MKSNYAKLTLVLAGLLLPTLFVEAANLESTNYKVFGGQLNPIVGTTTSASYNLTSGGQDIAGVSEGTNYNVQQGSSFRFLTPAVASDDSGDDSSEVAGASTVGGVPPFTSGDWELVSDDVDDIIFAGYAMEVYDFGGVQQTRVRPKYTGLLNTLFVPLERETTATVVDSLPREPEQITTTPQTQQTTSQPEESAEEDHISEPVIEEDEQYKVPGYIWWIIIVLILLEIYLLERRRRKRKTDSIS